MLCHHRSTFMMATVWSCIVSVDYLSALAPQSKILQWQLYLAVVSNFSPSSQAWKERLKHWTYTCTFVAFHSFIHYYYIYIYIYIYIFAFHLRSNFVCLRHMSKDVYRSWRLKKLAGKNNTEIKPELGSLNAFECQSDALVNWATRAPALEQSIRGINSLILRLDFW